MMEQKSIIDLLIIIGALGAMMFGMLKFFLRDIHKDLNEIKENSRKHEEKMMQSDQRIDHLYHICIEMLKRKH